MSIPRFPKRRRRGALRVAAAPLMAGVVILAVIVGSVSLAVARATTSTTYESCTVTEKEDRALASLDKREPRIYTDCGVFVVTDELLRFHFNAADVYNTLQEGNSYDLTTVGWRVGLFSWFPNIIEAKDAA